jgi:hypothetical protein
VIDWALQINDGRWRKPATGAADSKGKVVFRFTPKKAGTWHYRVHLPARSDLLAGDSDERKVKVHRH